MIKLIKLEFIKLWSKRSFLILFVSILILNIAIMAFTQNIDMSPSAYKQFQNKISQIPNDQRYTYVENYYQKIQAFESLQQVENLQKDSQKNKDLIESIISEHPEIKNYQQDYQNHQTYEFTDNLESESLFINKVYQEMTITHNYHQYIQNILNKEKTISSISIFQKEDDFSNQNLLKSANDYKNCLEIPITYESEKGVNDALSFPITHFLIIFSLIAISIFIIIEEKEKRLFILIQTTMRGRIQVIIAKSIVMFITMGIVIFTLTISQLFYISLTVGLGDLTRSIQSLSSYIQFPFKINIYQYIIFYIIIRWLVVSLIGTFILLISLITKNKIMCLLGLLSFFTLEFICYIFITPLSSLYLLKYINFIYILQTDQLFQIYRNVNIFSQAISLQLIISIVCILIFALLMTLLILSYYKKMNLQISKFKLPHFIQKRHLSLSLWKQELYKILWTQKVIIIMILCLGFQFYQYSHIQIYQDQDTLVYNQYMDILEGSLNKDKEIFIQSEKQRFLDLNLEINKVLEKEANHTISKQEANNQKGNIESLLQDENIFNKVYLQYERILENPSLQFVIPSIYQELFLSPTWTLTPYIMLFIFLAIALSQVYSFEYQNEMNKIIYTTVMGRKKLIYQKFIISLFITTTFFIIINIFPLITLLTSYPFSALAAPIQSIEAFQSFPIYIPLWTFIIIFYFIRLISVLSFTTILHYLELKTKNHLLTIIILCIFVIMPLILIYGNISILQIISIYPILLFPKHILQDNLFILAIPTILYLTITIFSLYNLIINPKEEL